MPNKLIYARQLIIDRKFNLISINIKLLEKFSKINDTEIIKILLTEYFIGDNELYNCGAYPRMSYLNIFKCYLEINIFKVERNITHILDKTTYNYELHYIIYKLATEADFQLYHEYYFMNWFDFPKLQKYIITVNPLIYTAEFLSIIGFKLD